MNARIAKEEMALLLPNSLTGYAPRSAPAPARPRHDGIVQMLANALRWVVELPRRRAVIDELNMLSDHELADIGLARSELARVFDPAFTAHRGMARN